MVLERAADLVEVVEEVGLVVWLECLVVWRAICLETGFALISGTSYIFGTANDGSLDYGYLNGSQYGSLAVRYLYSQPLRIGPITSQIVSTTYYQELINCPILNSSQRSTYAANVRAYFSI